MDARRRVGSVDCAPRRRAARVRFGIVPIGFLLLYGAGCSASQASRTILRREVERPAQAIPPVVAPAQAGAVNATVGAATGVSSDVSVQAVVPWGVVGLLAVVLLSLMVLLGYIVRLSHLREIRRIQARCRNGAQR